MKSSKAMTKLICFSLANWLYIKESSFTHRDRYIFYFVLQTILYQIFDTIVILIIGLILNKLVISIFIITAFIMARNRYKGYHANSILACGVFSISTITTCIVVSSNIFLGMICGYGLGYLIGLNSVKKYMRKLENFIFS